MEFQASRWSKREGVKLVLPGLDRLICDFQGCLWGLPTIREQSVVAEDSDTFEVRKRRKYEGQYRAYAR